MSASVKEASSSSEEAVESTTAERPAFDRTHRPFGGLTPQEAAVRRAEVAREKRTEREAEAELDRLTVSQRVSTALARELPYSALAQVVRSLAARAQDGNPTAARELRDWLKLAGLDAGELPSDVVDPRDMTPEQRATARARLLRSLATEDETPA